jgi:hypothetical protein
MRKVKEILADIEATAEKYEHVRKFGDSSEFQELRERIRKLQEEQSELERKLFDERKHRLDELYDKEKALRKELEEVRSSRKGSWLNSDDFLVKFLYDYQSGVDFSGKLGIVWASPNKKYIIVHKGPGRCWLSMTDPNAYVPSEYWLLDTAKGRYTTDRNSPIMKFEGGRLTKDRFSAFMKKVEELCGKRKVS